MDLSLREELQRAQTLLAKCRRKPFLEHITLEQRLDLAQTLATEENIDRLAAQIMLRRPIAEETPPWDDDPQLLQFFQSEEEELRVEEARRKLELEKATAEVKKAELEYEQFMQRLAAEQNIKKEAEDEDFTAPLSLLQKDPSVRTSTPYAEKQPPSTDGTEEDSRNICAQVLHRRTSFTDSVGSGNRTFDKNVVINKPNVTIIKDRNLDQKKMSAPVKPAVQPRIAQAKVEGPPRGRAALTTSTGTSRQTHLLMGSAPSRIATARQVLPPKICAPPRADRAGGPAAARRPVATSNVRDGGQAGSSQRINLAARPSKPALNRPQIARKIAK